MSLLVQYAALIGAAYLLGALPTGYLLTRFAKGVDVRRYGSGSTGATNVLRLLGWGAAVLVFVGDFGKGFLAVWGAGALGGGALGQSLAGLAALVGHNWPVFLGFRGGRGVSSGLGGLFAMMPPVAAVVMAVAVLLMIVTRWVSLGSVVGTAIAIILAVPAVIWGGAPAEHLVYVIPGVTLIVYRHKANLVRLLNGTEPKIGQKIAVSPATPASPKRRKARAQPRRAPIG